MSFYADMAALAVSMIATYGRAMTLRTYVSSGTVYSPTLTPTDTPITGVATKYKDADIDGTLIQAGDIKFLMDASVAPEMSGVIHDYDNKYQIINFKTVQPGDTVLLYEVQMRYSSELVVTFGGLSVTFAGDPITFGA